MNSPVTGFTPRVLEYLSRFDWPGNVRELENEIERAVTLAGAESKVKMNHLSKKITAAGRQALPFNVTQLPLKEATEHIERQMVAKALNQADGNRSQAASLLGLSRQGLLNKIERYNIKI